MSARTAIPDDVSSEVATSEADDIEWDRTKTSLRNALRENQELQAFVLLQLETIAQRKQENRLEAVRCICLEERRVAAATTATTRVSTEEAEPKTTRTKSKRTKDTGDGYIPTSDDINRLLAGETERNSTVEYHKDGNADKIIDDERKTKWSLYQRKRFRYDPHRKWTLSYFEDPTGSRPKDNEDTLRRKRLMRKPNPASSSKEPADGESMVPDHFFYHTSPPFTPQEMGRLDAWLWEEDHDGNDDSSQSYFYERVARNLREHHHEDPAARKKDKVLVPTCEPRSAEDIRLYHKHKLATRHKFTKQESLAILEGVTETTKQSAASFDEGETNVPPDRGPDWKRIHECVVEAYQKEHPASSGGPPFTPYQCMVHYKTKLRRRPDGSFTPEEDELLLRYIAAMGPQFIWSTAEISDLASRLFPNKPSRRIYERTHFSQWNPLSKDTIWTKKEEQKLVLAMKLYSQVDKSIDGDDTSVEEQNSNQIQGDQTKRVALEKAALRKAATHFQRQLYKVSKKWERSFSPRFSFKPFSKEEDAKLLEAVKLSATTTPFSEIAKIHFSDRSGDQLNQRWTKIAPDKDVVKKLVPFMIRSGVKRGLITNKNVHTMARNTLANGEQGLKHTIAGAQSGDSDVLFEPNDFILQVLPNDGECTRLNN